MQQQRVQSVDHGAGIGGLRRPAGKIDALAAEIAEGVVFANASLSHMPQSLAAVPQAKRSDQNFLIGNMLPVCVSEDLDAAKALLRRRLVHYAFLPNYRAY